MRDLISAGAIIVVLIAGASFTVSELKAKPTLQEVNDAIEKRTTPLKIEIEANKERVHKIKLDTQATRRDVRRMSKVVEYQLKHSAWFDAVLEHLANGRRGRVPSKPQHLLDAEIELLK